MKTISTLLIILATSIFSLNAQDHVIDTPLDDFNQMHVRGSIEVHYSQGGTPHLKCTLSEKASDAFIYKVDGSTLFLDTKKSPETIKVYISSPNIKSVDLGSSATFNSEGSIKGNAIQFLTSGASELTADVECEKLEVSAEGASEVELAGSAKVLIAKAQGAVEIDAKKLSAEDVEVNASGASDVDVKAEKSLKVYAEGASDVTFEGEPETVDVELEGIASLNDKSAMDDMIIINDGDTVSFGSKEIIIHDNDIDIDVDKKKFNGHWGGIDFAFNGFLNADNELNDAPGYSFMDLDFSKSWGLEFNFIEQNFNLIRNHFGLVTGLGLHIHNYRLDKTTRLFSDSATLVNFADTMSNTIRSKLVTNYLVLPLLIEYQTNGKNNKNSFHIGVGGFVGTRMSSHTKVVMDNGNGKDKYKSWNNYHLNPIKYGLMARIGWGHLNLFANYSLSPMFEDNEGPEVYPLEFGLTIVGW